MSFEIRTEDEYWVVCDILKSYKNIDNDFVSDLKLAVEIFKIRNYMDRIGPMKCDKCKYEWMAIISKTSNKLKCPKCYFLNDVPRITQEEKKLLTKKSCDGKKDC